MPSPRVFVGLLLLALGVGGCADLPEVGAGVCGNGVVDDGEDCDALRPEAGCVPPGQPGQCRYRCAEASAAAGAVACPTGWSCGGDGLCRVGQGRFVRSSVALDSGAGAPQTADFDGDGVPDLLTLGEPDLQGRRSARVLFLGRDGLAQSTLSLPLPIGQPVVGDITQDQRADLVFPYDLGPSVLVGQRDRSLLPLTYPLLSLPVNPGVVGRGGAVRFRTVSFNPAWCTTYSDQLGRAAGLCQALLDQAGGQPLFDLGAAVALQPSSRIVVLLQTGDATISLRADTRDSLLDVPAPTGAEVSDCQETKDSSPLDLEEETSVGAAEQSSPELLSRLPRVLVGGADTSTLGGMCDRVFIPMVGQRQVQILRPCAEEGTPDPTDRFSVVWRHQNKLETLLPARETLTVEAGLVVDGSLLLTHVDQDEFLDLLVGVHQGSVEAPLRYLVARGSFDGRFAGSSGGLELRFNDDLLPFRVVGSSREQAPGELTCGVDFQLSCFDVSDPGSCYCHGPPGAILATNDFNEDGVIDLVTSQGIEASIPVAELFGASFTHLLQPELGPLVNRGSYANLLRPWGEAVVGDFNGDNRLDLAAAPRADAGLEVLLATPEGTFNRISLQTNGQASQLVAGDVDGDQVPDLVFREEGPKPLTTDQLVAQDGLDPLLQGDALVVVRGRRDGLLAAPQSMGRLGTIDQVLVAPLSPSSRLRSPDQVNDIAVSARSLEQDAVQFSVLYGEAGGLPLSSYGIDSTACELLPLPLRTAAGDLDGDETPDLTVLALDDLQTGVGSALLDARMRLWALHAIGKGRFSYRTFGLRLDRDLVPVQVRRSLTTLATLASDDSDDSAPNGFYLDARLAQGDLDGDGRQEVVVLAPAEVGSCYDGRLGPQSEPNQQVLSLFCHSGLVVARPQPDAQGRTRLVADATIPLSLGTLGTGTLQLLDLDSDGFLDVVFTAGAPWTAGVEAQLGLAEPVTGRSELYVLWNDRGSLQTTPTPLLASMHTVRSLVQANLDGDPEPELIVQSDEEVRVLDRTTGRSFGDRVLAEVTPGTLAAGDINRDGLPDLLVNQGAQTSLYLAQPRPPGSGR